MKKRKGRNIRIVTEDLGGGGVTRENNDQTHVEEAIFSNIQDQRFYLAENASICNGRLRGEFGYLINTLAGDEVLGGTYDYFADFHPGTKELLEECARIRAQVPENSVCDFLGRREWQRRWLKAKENTSLSVFTLHFGHYIAGDKSDMISYVDSFKTSISLKHGTLLGRRANGLSVMLEKELGCTLINKLRAILLMEAEFNFSNKILYGVRMTDNVRRFGLMPEDIYSKKTEWQMVVHLPKSYFLRGQTVQTTSWP